MASRKKGKKTKGQTLNLTEFLSNGPAVVPIKSTSWADDPDDEFDNGGYMPKSSKEPVVLPTAPRAARGPGFEEENIPNSPPYVAYISNLPYDVVDEDLEELFHNMMISNIRLPKDSTKARGYGYVEFEEREGLIAALSMANTMVKTRRVRIDISNSSNEERRGGGRMGMNRDNNRRDGYDDPERTSGDWRSKPREEPSGSNEDRFRNRGGFENRDRRGDERETSENDNKPGGWREGERNTIPFNDKRGYRDDDRRGGVGFRNEERRPVGGYKNDERRAGDGNERDWSRDRNTTSFGSRRDGPRDDIPQEPRERPRLNLAPRTKPVEPIIVVKPEEESKPLKESIKETKLLRAADIFGAAKPVDTTAREREIEERLAKNNAEKTVVKVEDNSESKGTWVRRNGENRGDREKDKPKPTWRTDEDRNRHSERHDKRSDHRGSSSRTDNRGDTRGPTNSRQGSGQARGNGRNNDSRGPSERERKEKERDRDAYKEDPPMPKATDEPTVNFVASNKYSMLPEDVDPDIDA